MRSESDKPPYISFVAVSRNDDHGGNLLERMQLFVSSLFHQCQRHRLRSELILVDWNPPLERPKLAEALSWPQTGGLCRVRIIEVPGEIHSRFEHSARLPLFQMIGKNVAIRRSHGKFVTATNVDILFSDELIEFLAARQLERDKLYRIDRHDIPVAVPPGTSIHEKLSYCRDHVIRIHQRNGTIVFSDENDSDPGVDSGLEKNLVYYLTKPLKPIHIFAPVRWGLSGCRKLVNRFVDLVKLHTNASGDFTLMSRDNWDAIRGYSEFEMYSFHIDSLLCYAASLDGVEEVILEDPMRIYHMEHSLGSGWQPGTGGELLRVKLEKSGIRTLSDLELKGLVALMWLAGSPKLYNRTDGWGLADENLPETEPA